MLVNGRGEKAFEAYVSENMYDTFTVVPHYTKNSTRSQHITFYNNGYVTIEEGTSNILMYDTVRKKWEYILIDERNSFKFVSPQQNKKKPKKGKRLRRNQMKSNPELSDRTMVVKSQDKNISIQVFKLNFTFGLSEEPLKFRKISFQLLT